MLIGLDGLYNGRSSVSISRFSVSTGTFKSSRAHLNMLQETG
jgi:hypothetical protein